MPFGATVGSEEFKGDYVKMKVEEMTMELKTLSKIGETESHAAYAAWLETLMDLSVKDNC